VDRNQYLLDMNHPQDTHGSSCLWFREGKSSSKKVIGEAMSSSKKAVGVGISGSKKSEKVIGEAFARVTRCGSRFRVCGVILSEDQFDEGGDWRLDLQSRPGKDVDVDADFTTREKQGKGSS
jgi:hypothetical protein